MAQSTRGRHPYFYQPRLRETLTGCTNWKYEDRFNNTYLPANQHLLCQTQQTARTPPEHSGTNVALLSTAVLMCTRKLRKSASNTLSCVHYKRLSSARKRSKQCAFHAYFLRGISTHHGRYYRLYAYTSVSPGNSRLQQLSAPRTCMALVQMGSQPMDLE